MGLAWIIFLLEMLLMSLFKTVVANTEVMAVIAIGINALFVFFCMLKYKDKELGLILFFAYSLRLLVMFWDIYGRGILAVPHSGTDSEGFFYFASMISSDLSLLSGYIYGRVYTKFLGLLFYFIGTERILAQYINVLLGVTIIIIIYKSLVLLDIRKEIAKKSVLILSFFPHSIIFSGILLRENMVIFFVVLSFYWFTKWYKTGMQVNLVWSLISLIISSTFHSGVFAIVVGYFFMALFFSHKKGKLILKKSSMLIFLIGIAILAMLLTELREYFLPTFSRIETIEDFHKIVNARSGEAAYLKWMQINSLSQLLLYAPIRIIFFLFSPLPMDWRGANDILAFLLDSTLYVGLFSYILLNYNKHSRDCFLMAVLLSLAAVLFVFGVGVSNSGTALRHRNKILPLIVLSFSIIANKKYMFKKLKGR